MANSDDIIKKIADALLKLRSEVDILDDTRADLKDLKDSSFKEALKKAEEATAKLVETRTAQVRNLRDAGILSNSDFSAKFDAMLKDADIKLPESGFAVRDPGDKSDYIQRFEAKHISPKAYQK